MPSARVRVKLYGEVKDKNGEVKINILVNAWYVVENDTSAETADLRMQLSYKQKAWSKGEKQIYKRKEKEHWKKEILEVKESRNLIGDVWPNSVKLQIKYKL